MIIWRYLPSQCSCIYAINKFNFSSFLRFIHLEIYAAAKETVALAEQRFMSNSHEWQFDNAWQEMLNHATIKVFIIVCTKTQQQSLSFATLYHFVWNDSVIKC